MTSEAKLVDAARAASRDQAITVAGYFHPPSMAAKTTLGSIAGSIAGDAVGGAFAETAGAMAGGAAGMAAAGKEGLTFLVGVSPTHVHVVRVPSSVTGLKVDKLQLIRSYDRRHLHVEVRARIGSRILVLEDTATGESMKLDGSRAHWLHAVDVINELVIEGHADDGGDDAGAPTTTEVTGP